MKRVPRMNLHREMFGHPTVYAFLVNAMAAGLKERKFTGAHYNDSDVYKIIEGAVYSLKMDPDPECERYLDGLIAKIAAAQQDDGYLYTYFTINRPDQRFRHISPGPRHELYCMGHFIEAAVAHFQMTGKRTMLDVAVKLADHIDSIFGPGKRNNVPHHQEVESALIKLYLTGGVGAVGRGESFGNDYQLPNETAYAETCAGIGLIFFAHHTWQITPDAEYIDVLERTLYNEVLGGVAITGDAFFYRNKLLSTGEGWGSLRQKWFRCACCPSYICRFIPAVPGYMYGHLADNLYINSFIAGTATVKTDSQKIKLTQQTNYPWESEVKISVNPARTAEFTIRADSGPGVSHLGHRSF